jgi:ABC-type dipeptide/oligopeptide/nickel transport system ATPase component
VFSIGVGLCLSCVLPSHWVSKLSLIAFSGGLFYTSKRLDDVLDGDDGDAPIASTSTATSAQKKTVNPTSATDSHAKLAPIESALKKPHLMILGETGSGKSTICKYLVSQVNAPCLIIDPHAAPTDWVGFSVVGSGRNYEAIGSEFERLSELMQARYEARDKGQLEFQPLIVIIDEFPAIASALGRNATDTVKLLAREARKVQIRLCILSQGAEVKTLGIDGEGSIRECFAMLRLGNFALGHAKSLKDKDIFEYVSNCSHPAMLDQYPCNLPILSRDQQLPVLSMPSDYAQNDVNSPCQSPSTLVNPSIDSPCQSSLSIRQSGLSIGQSNLSAPLSKILEFAQAKGCVSAAAVKSGVRLFRDTSTTEIRRYFEWLENHGYGITTGDPDNLEFSAN